LGLLLNAFTSFDCPGLTRFSDVVKGAREELLNSFI